MGDKDVTFTPEEYQMLKQLLNTADVDNSNRVSGAREYATHYAFDRGDVWKVDENGKVQKSSLSKAMWHITARPDLYIVEKSTLAETALLRDKLSHAQHKIAAAQTEDDRDNAIDALVDDKEFAGFVEQNNISMDYVDSFFK